MIRPTGRMFSKLVNIVNTFAHQLMLLSGEGMQYDFLYNGESIGDMKDPVVQPGGRSPGARVSRWDGPIRARGAAGFAIEGVTGIAVWEISPDAQ